MAQVLQADYGVPHCKYERNPDGGFKVEYQGWSAMAAILLPIMLVGILVGSIIVAATWGGFFSFLLAMAAGGYGCFLLWKKLIPPTTIEVYPDSLTKREWGCGEREIGFRLGA
jgi:hypothetical protein